MKYGSLILEKKEYVALKRILNFHRHYEDPVHKEALERLKEGLQKALVIDEEETPGDVVRLYSAVTLSPGDGQSQTVQLVLPSEENKRTNKISVLSTLGAHLMGLAVSDTLQTGVPSNMQTLRIARVERPPEISADLYSRMDL